MVKKSQIHSGKQIQEITEEGDVNYKASVFSGLGFSLEWILTQSGVQK